MSYNVKKETSGKTEEAHYEKICVVVFIGCIGCINGLAPVQLIIQYR